jgi:hypothetical protein
LLSVADIESKASASVTLRAGDLAGIRVGIAHAFRPTAPGQAIEFSSARFDVADIHKYPVA